MHSSTGELVVLAAPLVQTHEGLTQTVPGSERGQASGLQAPGDGCGLLWWPVVGLLGGCDDAVFPVDKHGSDDSSWNV